MKNTPSYLPFFLILAINTTSCVDKSTQETALNKQKKLETDYQNILSLFKKCKDLIARDNPLNKYKAKGAIEGVIHGVSQIAAIYEVHVAFNAILTPEKKQLTPDDQNTINTYLASKSYSKENESLIANYLNCLLREQSAQYDIHSPQQGHINIPKKCYPHQTKMQRNIAKENLARANIQIDENHPLFKD